MSLTDEEFVHNVSTDIEHFLNQRHNNGVLLFPPVNSYRRFLIHRTCEDFRHQYDLCTFSVGQGAQRRTVICFKQQLLDPNTARLTTTTTTTTSETRKSLPSVKSWRSSGYRRVNESSNVNDTTAAFNTATPSALSFPKRNQISVTSSAQMGVEKTYNDTKLQKNVNSIDLYRPPALRNQFNETGSTSISCNNSPIHHCNTTTSRNPNDMTATAITTTHDDQRAASSAVDSGQRLSTTQQHCKQQQQQTTPARRERRPDRAVYIPRARRSQTTPPTTAAQTATVTVTTTACNHDQALSLLPLSSSSSTPPNIQQLAITTDSANATTLVSTAHSSNADDLSAPTIANNSDCNGIRENCNTIVHKNTASAVQGNCKIVTKKLKSSVQRKERSKRVNSISTEDNTNAATKSTEVHVNDEQNKTQASEEELTQQQQQEEQEEEEKEENHVNIECNSKIDTVVCDTQLRTATTTATIPTVDLSIGDETLSDDNAKIPLSSDLCITNTTMSSSGGKQHHVKNSAKSKHKQKQQQQNHCDDVKNKSSDLRIEDLSSNGVPLPTPRKCDNDEQELKRASKEINRSNRRIMKQTFVSDVLEIPDKIEDDKPKIPTLSKTTRNALHDACDTNETDNATENDSWEAMFDESGDCLDPKIMEELTATVGKVKIELPKMDYTAYLAKQSILNDEEFPHVLEVSNFPVEFKNQDLLMLFSQYKESGFDIKWVDDTHALAVFSSSRIAAEVLTMGHPFVVLKPLAEATVESRNKAKNCSSSLQPYRPRPKTCAALARRLVTGALGVRLKTAAAERENEKRVLREAKERKLLAAKQRDEFWEN